jgi:hypothetical protein
MKRNVTKYPEKGIITIEDTDLLCYVILVDTITYNLVGIRVQKN